MRELQRLLVIREDRLGDCCLSLPVLEAISDLSPNTRVTWLCREPFLSLFEDHPQVDSAVAVSRKPGLAEQLRMVRMIRKLKPDAVLHLRPGQRWKQVAVMAGVPIRVASLMPKNSLAITHPTWNMAKLRYHEARRALDALSTALDAEVRDYPAVLRISDERRTTAIAELQQLNLSHPFFAVQLGTGGSNAAMPPDFMARASKQIFAKTGLQPVLTGISSEGPLAQEFIRHFDGAVSSVVGKTKVVALAELLRAAKFLLSVDTGTVHLASAVGTPSVVIMPRLEISPGQWSPWMAPHRLIRPKSFCSLCKPNECTPGGSTCVSTISLDEVVGACLAFSSAP